MGHGYFCKFIMAEIHIAQLFNKLFKNKDLKPIMVNSKLSFLWRKSTYLNMIGISTNTKMIFSILKIKYVDDILENSSR